MPAGPCCFSMRSAGCATGACGYCCGSTGLGVCVSRRCRVRPLRLTCACTACRRKILTAWCWCRIGQNVLGVIIFSAPTRCLWRCAKRAGSDGFLAGYTHCLQRGAIRFIAASRGAVMRSLAGGSRDRCHAPSGRRVFCRERNGQRFLDAFFFVTGTTMTGQGAFCSTAWVVLPTRRS